MLNMLRLKKVLFDNFDGQKVYISSNGIVSMNFSIDNARIIANNQRIIIGNSNERDFIALDSTDSNHIRTQCEQLYDSKFDISDKMEKFFDIYTLSELTHKKTKSSVSLYIKRI